MIPGCPECGTKPTTVTIPADLMDAYVKLERTTEGSLQWMRDGLNTHAYGALLAAFNDLRKAQVTTKSDDADSGLGKGL